jgi:signal transduction histidine kinase
MVFKNLRFNLILRVIILVALLMVLSFVIINTSWFFTPIVLTILIVISVFELFHFMDKTNRELSNFFMSIRQAEFTTIFKGKDRGKSYRELFESLEQLMDEFHKLNLEKESQYQYLQALNENIGVAIISFRENGEIQFMNSAAKLLLRKPRIDKIEDIRSIDKKLFDKILNMQSGDKELVPMVLNNEWVQLSVQSRSFRLQDETFKLIILQNLHHELEEKEVEAWQKLINVLTHEIMNSVTPIVSLVKAVNSMLASNSSIQKLLSEMEADERSDFEDSLKTIEERSRGLLKFVNAYREYSTTPDFHPADFDFLNMVQRVYSLMKPELDQNSIRLNLDFGSLKKLNAYGDEQLIEQVIINLIKNAIHALYDSKEPLIELRVKRLGDRKVHLTVKDNGPGISHEVMDRIFVPFYTTRKGGTGIGLSLSRQIMKLHNGKIYADTHPDHGASFSIEF